MATAANWRARVAILLALAAGGITSMCLAQPAPPQAPAFTPNPHPFGSSGKPHMLPMRTPLHFLTAQSAPVGAHLTYYGGRIVSNMQVVQVLWGTGSYLPEVANTVTPNVSTFFAQALNSSYLDWLSEYNTAGLAAPTSGQVVGRGSFLTSVTITPSAAANGTTITDAAIQAELSAQIAAGKLPSPTADANGNSNTYYALFFPAGKKITQGTSSSCVSGGFCAYHGTIAAQSPIAELFYGVHPDMQSGSGCFTGCGGSSTVFANQTSVASHEMIETLTDAEVGLATTYSPPLSWYDATNGGIGDICNAQQATFVGTDSVTYTVQTEFSNLQANCVASAATVGDFSIAASPASLSVASGGTGTSTISTLVTSGGSAAVALSVSGLPSGATATLGATSVAAGKGTTLSLKAGTAAPGVYVITVTGIEGTASHSTTVSLTITTAADFSLSAGPSSVSVVSGSSATSTISTAVISGSGTVSLSATGVPTGATATFSPTSVAAGGASTLTLKSGTAAPGTYAVTVKGLEGTISHTAVVSLTITPVDFSLSATPSAVGVLAGASGTSVISTAALTGSGTVALSATGMPTGATASFSAASVTAGSASTLTLNSGTVAPGSYAITVKGVEGSVSHTASVTLTVSGINNGGMEAKSLTGWTASGTTTLVSGASSCHAGSYCARIGSTAAINANSSLAQTFAVPASGASRLSLYYKPTCAAAAQTYGGFTVALTDNTLGTTTTPLATVCTNSTTWANLVTNVVPGHGYTLTLTNLDTSPSGTTAKVSTVVDDVVLLP